MGMWNKASIAKKRRELLEAKALTPEELIDKVVALETALYPFAYTLGSLAEKSWKGTTATSKLFPLYSDDGKFQVYKPADGELTVGSTEVLQDIPEDKLHEVEYYECDSIGIVDGSLLHDDFEVLSVHQQAPGAYVSCGSVSMSDIREAKALIFPPRPTDTNNLIDDEKGE